MAAYYNEIDPYAAQWLRNLIAAGHIAPGDVDERSIIDVHPADLIGYDQCHFFAGIGGWSLALRMAGWGDARPVWTGSCPCQPFSTAGRQKGKGDDRHLWPAWERLIRELKPPTIFGEQVASAIAYGWLDEVCTQLEKETYACASAVLPACGVGAPHKRDRVWFVAHATGERIGGISGDVSKEDGGQNRQVQQQFNCTSEQPSPMANAQGNNAGWLCERDATTFSRFTCDGEDVADSFSERQSGPRQYGIWGSEAQDREGEADNAIPECQPHFWSVEPPLGRVANGIPARVGKLRALGNAIVPQVAAEFIKAYCG